MASPRRGEPVSVPCRACGRVFLKLTMAEGAHPLTCGACGRTTLVKIRCRGDACVVMTEATPPPDDGASGSN